MSWSGAVDGLRAVVLWLMDLTSVPILVYFAVINASYLLLIVLASLDFRTEHRRRESEVEAFGGALTPGVSLLVPAYNEAAGIVASVQALLSLRYPRHEVVVVDDGSSDGTFDRLREACDLVAVPRELPQDVPVAARVVDVHVPRDGRTRLLVVRKENSGRSEALNLALNAATEPLVAMIDADSILEPDGLLRVTQPFTDDPTRVVAAGGAIRPVNGSRVVSGRIVSVRMPRQWLARIQVVEYLRAFLLGRTGWSRSGALILISGAFGIFRRDVVVEVRGVEPTADPPPPARPGTRLPGRLRARAGVVDRGALDHRGAAQPAAPVAPRPVGDAVGLPRHAVAAALRPGRPGRPALLLGVRAVRAVARAVRDHHRPARARARGGQHPVCRALPRARLRTRHPGHLVRHGGRGVVLPPPRTVARPRG
jgi:hypothetical protein